MNTQFCQNNVYIYVNLKYMKKCFTSVILKKKTSKNYNEILSISPLKVQTFHNPAFVLASTFIYHWQGWKLLQLSTRKVMPQKLQK